MKHKYNKELSDGQWAAKQRQGKPACRIGDVVLFHTGGFGVIDEVSPGSGGWPPSYSTEPIKGKPDHPTTKRAWHYEGDFRVLAKSAVHEFEIEGSGE